MNELMKITNVELSKKSDYITNIKIGMLESSLLEKFPAEDSIEHDRCGLLVGDRQERIARVAVALDPTYCAVCEAERAGCNVLLTHHPIFREPVQGFHPYTNISHNAGNIVYSAIEKGVACMNFHTCLDVSRPAQDVLPQLLSLYNKDMSKKKQGYKQSVLIPISSSKKKGFGQLCEIDTPLTLGELSRRCLAVFGRKPRVWGDDNVKLTKIVTALGSGSSLLDSAIDAGADVVVAGEIGYHSALSAAEAGLCIIELGHDVSELPLVALLAKSAQDAGVNRDKIIILDQTHNWHLTDAIRM